jgi:hypothetical protein
MAAKSILDEARAKMASRVRRGLNNEDYGGLRKIEGPALEAEQPVYACPCRCMAPYSLGLVFLTEEAFYYASHTDRKPAVRIPIAELQGEPRRKRERPLFSALYLVGPEGELKFDLIRPGDGAVLSKAIRFLMNNPPLVAKCAVGSAKDETVTLRVDPGEARISWRFDSPKARGALFKSDDARDTFIREYNALARQRGIPEMTRNDFKDMVEPTLLFL